MINTDQREAVGGAVLSYDDEGGRVGAICKRFKQGPISSLFTAQAGQVPELL